MRGSRLLVVLVAMGAILAMVLLALVAAACGGDEGEAGATNATRTPAATVAASPRPTGTAAATVAGSPRPTETAVTTVAGNPRPTGTATATAAPSTGGTPSLPAGWTKIEPGGETLCSTGTPYAFWVHPGTVNRLVVYFEGGGACWDANTCSNPGLYYDDTVTEDDNPANHQQGMADLDNPENPFKDWFQVFVPYCTGDIHWGNQTSTYQLEGVDHTINHKGFANFSAVLDWVKAGFEEPEKIFVAGCSAGAYGSIMGAAYVHNLYPDAPLYQLSDAGAGVITQSFFESGFPNWGAEGTIPDWIPALQIPWQELTMAKLYIALADYYSSDRWAEYNSAHDETQTFFYTAMGGLEDWAQLMMAGIAEIQDATTNFATYTAPGKVHCITPLDIFYTREVNGVKFVDWLSEMVNDEPWDSVTCTDCETDTEAR